MPTLPSGTITLLFTDIEGSTRLAQELGAERFNAALSEHRRILRGAFAVQEGVELRTEGDSFFAAFASARAAVAAAAEAQSALSTGPLRVRIGIHTGEPLSVEHEDGYVGVDVHRAARICAAGHGGQVLISQATRDLLDEDVELRDLGEHRLKDLSEPLRLFQLGPRSFPALRSLSSSNLPTPLTPLIGRGRELSEIAGLLRREEVRLLTVTGSGGTGKTRLALAVGHELVEEFPNGVFFVGLASLVDPALVVPTIAHSLGIKERGAEPLLEILCEHLADKQLLLLVDNCEHVLDAVPLLSELLAAAPGLSVLATSRERLHLSGEQEFQLAPLAEREALELFTARARAAEPSFTLNGNRAEVAEICRRLDGLPLAIELAAARVRVLSTQALSARLEHRLPLLTGGARDLPERQRTLRATIAWSYELLEPEEQQLFVRLSVFAGGCTLEATEEVANAELDTLQSLLEKSLLRSSDERYWMLETIRDYAVERLEESGEAEEIRRRRDDHFLAFAEHAGSELQTVRQSYWLARLDVEEANLRAVVASALRAKRAELVCRLAVSLWRYWEARDRIAEARRLIEPALGPEAEVPSGLRAQALFAVGRMALRQGAYDRAGSWFAEGERLSSEQGDGRTRALCLAGLGWVASKQGDYEHAEKICRQSLGVARASGDAFVIADSLNNLGNALFAERNAGAAHAAFEESLALRMQIGDLEGVTASLGNLAALALEEGCLEEATALARQSQRLAEERADLWAIASDSILLAAVSIVSGRLSDCWTQVRRTLELSETAGYKELSAVALQLAAGCLALEGRDHDAARLEGLAESLSEARSEPEFDFTDEYLSRARERLGDTEWCATREAGKRLRIREAIDLLPAIPENVIASPAGANAVDATPAPFSSSPSLG
jgi:predicted ATPase/class 3 adenylate cyclase